MPIILVHFIIIKNKQIELYEQIRESRRYRFLKAIPLFLKNKTFHFINTNKKHDLCR